MSLSGDGQSRLCNLQRTLRLRDITVAACVLKRVGVRIRNFAIRNIGHRGRRWCNHNLISCRQSEYLVRRIRVWHYGSIVGHRIDRIFMRLSVIGPALRGGRNHQRLGVICDRQGTRDRSYSEV